VTIRPDGSVSNAKILESKPKRLFDKSALDAIKRWKFRPKVVNGSPVSQRARQVIEFKLDNAT
jgi:protein TonB